MLSRYFASSDDVTDASATTAGPVEDTPSPRRLRGSAVQKAPTHTRLKLKLGGRSKRKEQDKQDMAFRLQFGMPLDNESGAEEDTAAAGEKRAKNWRGFSTLKRQRVEEEKEAETTTGEASDSVADVDVLRARLEAEYRPDKEPGTAEGKAKEIEAKLTYLQSLKAPVPIGPRSNAFYYRHLDPEEEAKKGSWSEEEVALFRKRYEACLNKEGKVTQWGYFSCGIPGRVGYTCVSMYRNLVRKGEMEPMAGDTTTLKQGATPTKKTTTNKAKAQKGAKKESRKSKVVGQMMVVEEDNTAAMMATAAAEAAIALEPRTPPLTPSRKTGTTSSSSSSSQGGNGEGADKTLTPKRVFVSPSRRIKIVSPEQRQKMIAELRQRAMAREARSRSRDAESGSSSPVAGASMESELYTTTQEEEDEEEDDDDDLMEMEEQMNAMEFVSHLFERRTGSGMTSSSTSSTSSTGTESTASATVEEDDDLTLDEEQQRIIAERMAKVREEYEKHLKESADRRVAYVMEAMPHLTRKEAEHALAICNDNEIDAVHLLVSDVMDGVGEPAGRGPECEFELDDFFEYDDAAQERRRAEKERKKKELERKRKRKKNSGGGGGGKREGKRIAEVGTTTSANSSALVVDETTSTRTGTAAQTQNQTQTQTPTMSGSEGSSEGGKTTSAEEPPPDFIPGTNPLMVKEMNVEGEQPAHITEALKAKQSNPNRYYYRLLDEGEKQRRGMWEADESNLLCRYAPLYVDPHSGRYQWGLISRHIPGRVGYQCASQYRRLVKQGVIVDPNYSLSAKGELLFQGGRLKQKMGDEADAAKQKKRDEAAMKKRAAAEARRKEKRRAEAEARKAKKEKKLAAAREKAMRKEEEERRRKREVEDRDNPVPELMDMITMEGVVQPMISPFGHVLGKDTWTALFEEQIKHARKQMLPLQTYCPFTKQPLSRRSLVKLTHENIEEHRSRILNA